MAVVFFLRLCVYSVYLCVQLFVCICVCVCVCVCEFARARARARVCLCAIVDEIEGLFMLFFCLFPGPSLVIGLKPARWFAWIHV